MRGFIMQKLMQQSLAGVAAALTAIAAENSSHIGSNSTNIAKEAALTSAATLVAAHCVKIAKAMGAKKHQISIAMRFVMSATSENHILTLTVAASTSLQLGAAAIYPDDPILSVEDLC
ncbi:VAN3-binding protein-like protein [Tanacetum coccineum]